MRRALALPLTLALGACTGPAGWVGTVRDGGPADCSATRVPASASAVIPTGAAWPGEFTFEGWYRLDAAPSAPFGRIAGVDASGACASGVNLWEIRVDSSGVVTGTLGATYLATGAGAPVAMGQWFHVALQYEGAGTGALYVNGARVQSYALTSGAPNVPNACPLRLASADDGVSNRVAITFASLRFRRFKHYVDGFTPERVLERDADTLYLFDPAVSASPPFVDGSFVVNAASTVQEASGPGC